MDQCHHPLDHLLSKESVVLVMVYGMDLKLLVSDKQYYIYIFDHKSGRNKTHEVLQQVAVEMEVWIALELPLKYSLQT